MNDQPQNNAAADQPARTAVSKHARLLAILAVVAGVFGVASVISGGLVVFGGAAARQLAGDAVPFVVWFNFLAGFAYTGAAVGLWRRHRWGAHLAMGIAVATVLVFAAFGLHVFAGDAFEPRTVAALILRAGLWLGIAAVARQALLRAP